MGKFEIVRNSEITGVVSLLFIYIFYALLFFKFQKATSAHEQPFCKLKKAHAVG